MAILNMEGDNQIKGNILLNLSDDMLKSENLNEVLDKLVSLIKKEYIGKTVKEMILPIAKKYGVREVLLCYGEFKKHEIQYNLETYYKHKKFIDKVCKGERPSKVMFEMFKELRNYG